MLRSAALLVVPCVLVPLAAQCDPAWAPSSGVPGLTGPAYDLAVWDPDGPGPAAEQILIAGSFRAAGDLAAQNLVAYDPATGRWTEFGSGVNLAATALLSESTAATPGAFVVGGAFSGAGGVPAANIARWDGSAWQPLGGGLGTPVFNTVQALARLPNGDLLAGGFFQVPGPGAIANLAVWDGERWASFAGGANDRVRDLLLLPNGDLLAAGDFTVIGSTAVSYLARWDGARWSAVGGGIDGVVEDLALAPNGDVVVAGRFRRVGGSLVANGIARWDGAAWSALGSGVAVGFQVSAVDFEASGELWATGHFSSIDGVVAQAVARWDGAVWSPLGGGLTNPASFALGNAILRVGGATWVAGAFAAAGGQGAAHLAVWRGSGGGWQRLGDGFSGPVYGGLARRDGSLVTAGAFRTAPGGIDARYIAERDPAGRWHALGSGLDEPAAVAIELSNGDLLCGGSFTRAGGTPASSIARWDGSQWSAWSGDVFDGSVDALVELPNGHVVAAGFFRSINGRPFARVARWDGSSWQPMGQGFTGPVRCLAVLPGGDVVAGGAFRTASNALNLARWDGARWVALGGADFDLDVRALLVAGDGTLYAGGRFRTVGGVFFERMARWDGSTWSPVGNGFAFDVHALAELPNGDLVAAGGVGAQRWDGSAWTSLGVGGPIDPVQFLAMQPTTGRLAIGGLIFAAGGRSSPWFAELVAPCVGSATRLAGGCPSSGGANRLYAEEAPWVGGTYVSRGTGLPVSASVAVAFGIGTASVPLRNLFPAGVAGCDLLVTTEVVSVAPSTAGVVELRVPVPADPALAGSRLFQQLIVLERGSGGGIVAVTSSNPLDLRVGWF